jgi:hypothetical protein
MTRLQNEYKVFCWVTINNLDPGDICGDGKSYPRIMSTSIWEEAVRQKCQLSKSA